MLFEKVGPRAHDPAQGHNCTLTLATPAPPRLHLTPVHASAYEMQELAVLPKAVFLC